MLVRSLVLTCALAACSSDPTPADAPATTTHDAPHTTIDAPATTIDAPAMAACTGALYDSCTDNTKCMSNDCKAFASAGLMVCTQACSSTNPCPAQNGVAIMCNGMGICRPNAANACTPQ
jgi:hypothetical protein